MHSKVYLTYLLPREIHDIKCLAHEYAAREHGIEIGEPTPAHATIKYGLDIDAQGLQAISNHLKCLKARRQLQSVRAHSDGFKFFPESRTIYLALIGPIIDQWRFILREVASMGYPEKGYDGKTLHASMLSELDIDPGQLENVRMTISQLPSAPPGYFDVGELAFYRSNGGTWDYLERIPLH